MPAIQFIIQRGLILLGGLLTFVGITPESVIDSPQIAIEKTEMRQEMVSAMLKTTPPVSATEPHEEAPSISEFINTIIKTTGTIDLEIPDPVFEQKIVEISNVIPKAADEVREKIKESLPDVVNTNIPTIPEEALKDVLDEVVIPTESPIPIKKDIITESVTPDSKPELEITPIETDVPVSTHDIFASQPKDAAKRALLDAVIQIECQNKIGNTTRFNTGSGVLISPDGIILTNAHVAQYFLLENYSQPGFMKCSVRRGDLPTLGYTATLIYIPEAWIKNNLTITGQSAPRGTGEYDFALLKITGSTNPGLIPPSFFPYIEPSLKKSDAEKGNDITVVGYPGIQNNPLNVRAIATIQNDTTSIADVYTFNSGIDIFSTEETPVAKRGSSGGAIIHKGKLIGLTSTTGAGTTYDYINALTTSYINKELKKETGQTLTHINQSTNISVPGKVITTYAEQIGDSYCSTRC